jgi:hypothetical protein
VAHMLTPHDHSFFMLHRLGRAEIRFSDLLRQLFHKKCPPLDIAYSPSS